jgi:hypothetical protein
MMIAEFGHYALVLALALAFVQATEEALREYGRIITPLATSLDAILSVLRDFGRT